MLETGPGHYVPGTKARDEQYAHRNNPSPRTPRHVYLILGRFAQRGPNKGTGVTAPHQVLQRVTSHRPRRLFIERSGKGEEPNREKMNAGASSEQIVA